MTTPPTRIANRPDTTWVLNPQKTTAIRATRYGPHTRITLTPDQHINLIPTAARQLAAQITAAARQVERDQQGDHK